MGAKGKTMDLTFGLAEEEPGQWASPSLESIQGVYLHLSSLFECERPKGLIPGFGPFAHLVKQHGTRPIGDGLDSSFGDTILKVSTDAAEVQFLIQELDISLEFG